MLLKFLNLVNIQIIYYTLQLSYRKAVNSNCLIGVTDNGRGRYVSKIMTNSEQRYLGTFNTPEEAFYVYKEAKEDYIKEVANKTN